jgi:hypothetical protein
MKGFTSATQHQNGVYSGNVRFVIDGFSHRHLSTLLRNGYSVGKDEFVFPAGTAFRVTRLEYDFANLRQRIYLREERAEPSPAVDRWMPPGLAGTVRRWLNVPGEWGGQVG